MTIFDFMRNRVDILDVIGSYVSLKRVGSYFKGSCPFHKEADASFTISPSKQIFFCFGCKKNGDSIGFIAEIEQVTQMEAVTYLAEKWKIELPQDLVSAKLQSGLSQSKDIYILAHQVVASFCHSELAQKPEALDYLRQRGISDASIKNFSIGFFPSVKSRKNALIKLLFNNSVLQEDLLNSGLFMLNNQQDLVSPFEDRIVFPIYDSLARCVGFGGRVFLQNDQRPKYYNSRETELFLKKKLLFGYHQAKSVAVQRKAFFMVEGYLDAVMMHQYGYQNCVATLGTACSREQLMLMEKFADTLFVMYDNDQAGVSAVLKLAEASFDTSLEVKVVELDRTFDPASQLQSNKDLLQTKIDNAKDILSFFITALSDNFFALTGSKKVELLEKMSPVLQKISNPVKKYVCIQKLAYLTGVDFKTLQSLFGSKLSFEKRREAPLPSLHNQNNEITAEEILFFYEIVQRQNNVIGEVIDSDLYQIFPANMVKLLQSLDENNNDLDSLIEKMSLEEQSWLKNGLNRLALMPESISVQALMEKIFLKFTRAQLSTCDRTVDLSVNSDTRSRMTVIISKIQNLNNRIKHKSLIQTEGKRYGNEKK